MPQSIPHIHVHKNGWDKIMDQRKEKWKEKVCMHLNRMWTNPSIPTWFASELELLWEVVMGEAVRGCWRAEKEDGDGWMRGGVWPKAFRPLCWDNSCWYATGLIGWGKLNEGLGESEANSYLMENINEDLCHVLFIIVLQLTRLLGCLHFIKRANRTMSEQTKPKTTFLLAECTNVLFRV